mgnify:FL=1
MSSTNATFRRGAIYLRIPFQVDGPRKAQTDPNLHRVPPKRWNSANFDMRFSTKFAFLAFDLCTLYD